MKPDTDGGFIKKVYAFWIIMLWFIRLLVPIAAILYIPKDPLPAVVWCAYFFGMEKKGFDLDAAIKEINEIEREKEEQGDE